MNDFLHKSLLLGTGLYAKTAKEVRKAVAHLVKTNRVSKKEGEKLVAEAVAYGKKLEQNIATQTRRISLEVIRKLKVATHRDLALLEKKLKNASVKILKK